MTRIQSIRQHYRRAAEHAADDWHRAADDPRRRPSQLQAELRYARACRGARRAGHIARGETAP